MAQPKYGVKPRSIFEYGSRVILHSALNKVGILLILCLQRLCHNMQDHTFSYFCHSGLDPESIMISEDYWSGCRIGSGMTNRKEPFIGITTQPFKGREMG